MPAGLAAGLTQGVASGLAQGVQLKVLQDIQGARKEFFESESKINKARATQVETRQKLMQALGIGQLLAGDQGEAITEQNIPGTAPLGEGEQIGSFPPTSEAGEQDRMNRLFAALALNEGQIGQARQILQPPAPKSSIVEFGNELLAISQDPTTGNVRSQLIAQQEAPGQFTSMGTVQSTTGESFALALNQNTGDVRVVQLGVEEAQAAADVSMTDIRVIAEADGKPGEFPVQGIPIDTPMAKSILKRAQEEKIEVAERTGAAAQERREQAELDKTINVTGDLFMKPVIKDGQLIFDRPKGTTAIGKAGEQGFLNVTGQRTAVEKVGEAQNALRILDSLEPMITELIQAEPGLTNILTQALTIQTDKLSKGGELTNFRNESGKRLTRGELAAAYNRRVRALTRTLGRATGEKGVFTDKDVDDFKATLPGSLDTSTLAQTFLDEQRRFFAQRIEDQVRNVFGNELTPEGITDALLGRGQATRPKAQAVTPKVKPQPQTFGEVIDTLPLPDQELINDTLVGMKEGTISPDIARVILGKFFKPHQVDAMIEAIMRQTLERAS